MSDTNYLDANAGVPASQQALDAYMRAAAAYGNPSSPHAAGADAARHLRNARAEIAEFVGAEPEHIVFTSGGTESNALALAGTIAALDEARPHVVTTTVEHAAVANTLDALRRRDRIELTCVEVDRSGRVDVDRFVAALRKNTRLVSVVAACNETGVLQPVREIAAAVRQLGGLIHTDAVQAVGRVPVDVSAWDVDLLALSGHKLGAVGGIGALVVGPSVELRPLLLGGGQERGLRGTTENVAGSASLAAALRHGPTPSELGTLGKLRDNLEAGLTAAIDGVEILGADAPRLGNTTCVRIDGCEGDGLMMALDVRGIAISTGSACSSGSVEPSAILMGMGLGRSEAKQTVRYSLTRSTSADDIEHAIAITVEVVAHMRE